MQEDKLRPGEFVNNTGALCKVLRIVYSDGEREQVAYAPSSDHFPAAAAAAAALADEAQWVELGNAINGCALRIFRDGKRVQVLLGNPAVPGWVERDCYDKEPLVVGYRAALRANGISVGGGE